MSHALFSFTICGVLFCVGMGSVACGQQQGAATKPAPITVELATWEQTQKIIAEQKGKIVVLDFWSTWCEPCVKEFPGLVKLQQEHPQEIVCISLNCNYIGDDSLAAEKAAVLEFVTKQQARIRNLVCNEADEKLYEKAKITSVPVVQVYDRSGKLLKQFDNDREEYGKAGFTYEKHINQYIGELIAKPK